MNKTYEANAVYCMRSNEQMITLGNTDGLLIYREEAYSEGFWQAAAGNGYSFPARYTA
jgi:hypothetical protein